MSGAGDVSNGRVTTREFYEELLKTREEIGHIRGEIIELKVWMGGAMDAKMRDCPLNEQVKDNREDIKKLRTYDKVIAGLAVVGSAIAGLLGK